jgi:hypothetical protein
VVWLIHVPIMTNCGAGAPSEMRGAFRPITDDRVVGRNGSLPAIRFPKGLGCLAEG